MKKRIGILGGMSPESTAEFYLGIVSKYFSKYKDNSYPEILIFCVDFQKMIALQEGGDKKSYIQALMIGINSLITAGADFITIPSNAPHVVYHELAALSSKPILSIVENTAQKAKSMDFKRLLLTGTLYTMQSDYYKLEFEKYGIHMVVPGERDQQEINRIIFAELVHGKIKEASANWFKKMIETYEVDGVVLGCTELPMLIKQTDTTLTLLNTLDIHAEKTLEYSLGLNNL
ncbi:MAG: amino acid racemase [Patescibacteria group bacterium]